MSLPIVGIGCDIAQELAAEVLKYSVLSHASGQWNVVKLHELLESLEIEPAILRAQKTSFSFQRFLLARFMLEQGAEFAIYLDSDMLALRPVEDLIALFTETGTPLATVAPLDCWGRRRQSSVLVMNREGATQLWSSYQRHQAGKISYNELIYLETVGPVGTLPYHWNCLEYLDDKTALIHYTDMDAQPWLRDGNPNAGIWYTYLWRFAKRSGGRALIEREIAQRHVRPALNAIIKNGPSISMTSSVARLHDLLFVPPHRFRRIRNRTVRQFFAPLLRGIIYMQFLLANGQPNIR